MLLRQCQPPFLILIFLAFIAIEPLHNQHIHGYWHGADARSTMSPHEFAQLINGTDTHAIARLQLTVDTQGRVLVVAKEDKGTSRSLLGYLHIIKAKGLKRILLLWPTEDDLKLAKINLPDFADQLKSVLIKAKLPPSRFIFAHHTKKHLLQVQKRWPGIHLLVVKINQQMKENWSELSGVCLMGKEKPTRDFTEKLAGLKQVKRRQWLISPFINNTSALQYYHDLHCDALLINEQTAYQAFLEKDKPGRHLRHYYAFNGDLEDRSPNPITASVKDPLGKKPVFTDGLWDQALYANETKEEKYNPIRLSTGITSQGTIAFWFKQTHTRKWQTTSLIDCDVDADTFHLFIRNGELSFQLHPKTAVMRHPLHKLADISRWHHVVISWQKFKMTSHQFRIYLNGLLLESLSPGEAEAAAIWFENWPMQLQSLYLGAGHASHSHTDILFDDVVIFDTQLNELHLKRIYQDGVRKSLFNWRGKLITD